MFCAAASKQILPNVKIIHQSIYPCLCGLCLFTGHAASHQCFMCSAWIMAWRPVIMIWQVDGADPSLLLGKIKRDKNRSCRGDISFIYLSIYCGRPAVHLHHQGPVAELLHPLWISTTPPHTSTVLAGVQLDGKSPIIKKAAHKHLMVHHEYFRALNILQEWPLEKKTKQKATTPTDTSQSDAAPVQACFPATFWVFFFLGMIGLICHLRQKEPGYAAVDNPIYRCAIYYKFLWLLGPLSHRFVDCLLSWVLMSCCLNHCIISALIHFHAYT